MMIKLLVSLITSLCIFGMVSTAGAIRYDAFDDFNSSSNTIDNIWQYGGEDTLEGTFLLSGVRTEIAPGVVMWETQKEYSPVIGNSTGTDVTVPWDSNIILPKEDFLHLHPGINGQFGIIRWVCPTSDYYQIDSTFKSLRTAGPPTTTDIHVLYNSTSVYDSYINGFMDEVSYSYSALLFLQEGDTIDFAVGYGQNNNWHYDSTGLKAVIANANPVPEPITMLLFGIGIAGLAGIKIRRK